jgi:WD40 repeat protein
MRTFAVVYLGILVCVAVLGGKSVSFSRHGGRPPGETTSPDGQTLAKVTDKGKTIELWDTATGKKRARLVSYSYWVSHIAFSPDSKTLVSADYPYQSVNLWDVSTGEERSFEGVSWLDYYEQWIDGISFSSDSNTLVVRAEWRLGIWDVESGKLTGTSLYGFPFVGLPRSGRLVVWMGGGRTVRVWEFPALLTVLTAIGAVVLFGKVTTVCLRSMFRPGGGKLSSVSHQKMTRGRSSTMVVVRDCLFITLIALAAILAYSNHN